MVLTFAAVKLDFKETGWFVKVSNFISAVRYFSRWRFLTFGWLGINCVAVSSINKGIHRTLLCSILNKFFHGLFG